MAKLVALCGSTSIPYSSTRGRTMVSCMVTLAPALAVSPLPRYCSCSMLRTTLSPRTEPVREEDQRFSLFPDTLELKEKQFPNFGLN